MRDLVPHIERWRLAGKQVVVATVVQVYGSALRSIGAKMAISSAGDMAGSVSGGCIEGAVVEEARRVFRHRQPKLVEYGVSNETAWSIGLACGGTIQVWVELLDDAEYLRLVHSLETRELVALATIVDGVGKGLRMFIWPDGRTEGNLGDDAVTGRAVAFAADRMRDQNAGRDRFAATDRFADVFVDVFAPPARLVVVGAVHIAIPLVTYARTLGMRTIVVDPRTAFATRERFPHADELIVEWPQEVLEALCLDPASYVVIVTHDDKIDSPALQAALASPARYVGILGSRKTHAKRVQALKELGVPEDQLARIHAPIGLAIGAVGPEEIALSILAEVVAVRHGVEGRQVGATNT